MDIVLQDVAKVFGEQRAVDALSFSAQTGITGFLGPNGAGKSTTMRMITGFLQPTTGTITIGGDAVWPSTSRVRRRVGYLPEHNPLYTDMYVREYLQFIASAHSIDQPRQRIEEVIDRVGLRAESRKLIGTLSKGYRQRVGLAQALLHDPEVLVLDEPTSGLDPNQLVEIRNVIRTLGQEKVVLLSTHIMQEVQALCQRVLIINQGKLVADDPIAALGDRLAGQQRIYLECDSVIEASPLMQISGVQRVEISGHSATLIVSAEAEIRPLIARVCNSKGWGLLELRRESATIESAFQALTAQTATDV